MEREVSVQWIERQMVFMNTKLGIYKLNNYFIIEPTRDFYEALNNINSINEAMRMLSRHIELATAPKVEWMGYSNQPTNDLPGQIKYNGPYQSTVRINKSNINYPYIVGAILAHELTHYFLFIKGIGYSDVKENERFTDFVTVYLGLGKLMLNGYIPVSRKVKQDSGNKEIIYKVGYLNIMDLAVIFNQVIFIRGLSLSSVRMNLNHEAEKMLKITHKLLLSRREKLRKSQRKVNADPSRLNRIQKEISKSQELNVNIVTCDKCGQKMRIPNMNKTLKVKCPGDKCANEFYIKPL